MEELRKICAAAIAGLTAGGADKAKCTVTKGRKDEFNIDGGRFSLFRTTFDSALNMSCIKDGRRGVVATNRLDGEALNASVAECIKNAAASDADPAWDIAPNTGSRSFTVGCPEADTERLFERTKEFLETVNHEYPTIMLEQVIVSHVAESRVIMNSNGVDYVVKSGCYELSVMYSAHEDGAASSFAGDGAVMGDLDTPFIELATIRRSFDAIVRQVHTSPVEGKFTGVMVLPPVCLADFLYMLFENTVSDTVMIDGTSLWKDKLGLRVADGRITVAVSPLDQRFPAGERVTGDGFEAADYKLIDKGVLSSFMLSLYAANKLGKQRAANSGMNFVVTPGEKSIDELIKGVERGIYVGRFSGGSPTSNGDFSGVAKNSFLIENGRLTDAVSETMINGNLAAMLNSLAFISSDASSDGMMALPFMGFDGITVSGK